MAKIIDSPIHRIHILELDDDRIDALIAEIRERRSSKIIALQDEVRATRAVADEVYQERLEKLAEQIEKLLNDMDKKLSKAEQLAMKLRVLRMEMST